MRMDAKVEDRLVVEGSQWFDAMTSSSSADCTLNS